jgi:hypothetical protein
MAYTLTTPYQWQTWGTDYNTFTPYSRLAGRRFIGGTIDGPIAPSMTDVARGQTIIVNGTTVTLTLTPSQDELAAASYYFLGGHEYEISDTKHRFLLTLATAIM